jgi:ABC-2 type transport system permease protein
MDSRGDSRRSHVARMIAYGLLAAMGVLFSAAVGFGAGELITNPHFPLSVRLGTLPGLMLTIVLAGTVVIGVNQAIRALYLTNDMELLFSAPLRTEAIMTAKLLSRLPSTIIITLILTVPGLIAFGISTELGPAFIAAGATALLLAPLFGLSAGALLAMLIVRVLPAERVSEYLGAASIIIGVLIAIVFQLPRLIRGSEGPIDPQTAESLSAIIANLESIPLPTMWAGQGLVDLAQGRAAASLGSLSLYLLLTAGFFALTALLANQLYLSGWLRMQGSGYTRGGYTAEAGLFGSSSVGAGIAMKDWFLRLRDARQLAGLVSGIIFAGFFGFLMLRPGDENGLMAAGEAVPFDLLRRLFSPGVLISGVILYAGWATFNRSAITALSIEAKSFYILKAAPVAPRAVFRSKVLGLAVPYAVFALLLLLISWVAMRFSVAWIPYAWLCLVIIGYGMITITTAMGFRYPRLDWDDPRRMTNRKAGIPNLILNLGYGLLSLVIAVLPFVLGSLFPRAVVPLVLLGLLLLAGMALLAERLGARVADEAWAGIEVLG